MDKLNETEAKKLGLRNSKDQHNALSENFVKIYANNVGIGASNWDVSITFGEILGLADDGQPVVEQKVKVNMTREFMKALSNLLVQNVKAYEEQFGEIDFERMFAITEKLEAEAAKKAIGKRTPTKSRIGKKS